MANHEEVNYPWLSDQEDESIRPEALTPTFAEIFDRRKVLQGLATLPLVAAAGSAAPAAAQKAAELEPSEKLAAVWDDGITFQPIAMGNNDFINVADGYDVSLIAAWGHPVVAGAPAFNPMAQNPEAQAMQFGYNCDFVGYLPLPGPGSRNSEHGLLGVNHEYVNPELMFMNFNAANITKAQADITLAAHGFSVIEVQRTARAWENVLNSRFGRRITGTTPIDITGPAAGDVLLRTSADATGRRVLGTLNNCAGGVTPWGTYLTAEENFNQYFANVNAMPDGVVKTLHQRYGLPTAASGLRWESFYDRFDCVKEPNEANRFGWIVEIDPYDPTSIPKKRTALGRFKHEAATIVIAENGRVVAYTGDDERFDYMYKFVSSGRYNANDRAANMNLLDEGTLYVARFNADGTGAWLPLVFGQGPLTAANGWRNQADVLIRARQAGDALGATRMDRPEDIEANPITGKVYVALTNNTNRTAAQVDRANPRAINRNGHIIELVESGNDHTATSFRWEIFMLCGLPTDEDTYFAGFDKKQVSPISCPDNIAFDSRGVLWIATDGMEGTLRFNDTIYACPTEGPNRGRVQPFMSVCSGAEVCGPEFTPDSTTLFFAVQHPGEGGAFGGTVVSNWPFGQQPPRPSVGAIFKKAGVGARHIGS